MIDIRVQELNCLSLNKRTMNSGYIFFNDKQKVENFKSLLEKLNIGYTLYIDKAGHIVVYGFKIFRIKRQFLELCAGLKEVLE